MNHAFFLKRSNICTSKFWAIKNAIPDPIAILIDIMSEKLVETNKVSNAHDVTAFHCGRPLTNQRILVHSIEHQGAWQK